jgi:cellulose synthase/poly-beta-1,6-N-acetylglucosamine synthase-like glycosyltransferase
MLTDCGTYLERGSTLELVQHMERHHELSAVTGFGLFMESGLQGDQKQSVWNPIYRSWQIMDYEGQSLSQSGAFAEMGFMLVLPGPLQFCRSSAIFSDGGVVDEYLQVARGATPHEDWKILLRSNLRLTEDRILAFAMVCARKDRISKTGFVPSARFYVDSQTETLPLLIQRRRWTNGTLAALWTILSTKMDDLWAHPHLSFRYKFTVHLVLLFEASMILLPLLSPFITCINIYLATQENLAAGRWWTAFYWLSYLLFVGVHFRNRFHTATYTLFNMTTFLTLVLILAKYASALMEFDMSTKWLIMSATACVSIMLSLAAMVGAIAYGRQSSFWRIVVHAPLGLLCSVFSVTVWSQYNVARFHDCSWGTRPSAAQLRTDDQIDIQNSMSATSSETDCLSDGPSPVAGNLRERHAFPIKRAAVDSKWEAADEKRHQQIRLWSRLSIWLERKVIAFFSFMSGDADYIEVDGKVDVHYQMVLKRYGVWALLTLIGVNLGGTISIWIMLATLGTKATSRVCMALLASVVTMSSVFGIVKVIINFVYAFKWWRQKGKVSLRTRSSSDTLAVKCVQIKSV